MRTRFGVFLDLRNRIDEVETLAMEAEKLGYDSVWVPDHLLGGGNYPRTTDQGQRHEAWTVLTLLACRTTRVRLGPLVLCCLYRNPALTAKMACTFDAISHGRLNYGIGAGWRESECVAYGLPYPGPAERVDRLRETALIAKKMWTETPANFRGKYYRIESLYCEPKPVQRPHPPIMIAGSGERKMLRVVGELADMHNMFAATHQLRDKVNLVRQHARSFGRTPDDIQLTLTFGVAYVAENHKILEEKLGTYYKSSGENIAWNQWLAEVKKGGLVGSPDECTHRIEEFKKLGFTHFILRFADFPSDEGLKSFARSVMPQVS
jgi:probable F420-dependent oxidoreductase